MNKNELIKSVAADTKKTIKEVTEVVDLAIARVIKSLEKGEEVSFAGFGKFVVKRRAARESINPRTKEVIKVPASNAVGFKVSKALKEAVNKKRK